MTSKNYLHECLDEFPRVSMQQFSHESHVVKIEKAVASLRTGKVSVVDVLEKFEECFQKERWMQMYWLPPSVDGLTEEEKSRTFSFHQFFGVHEKEKIHELLDVVRQIELVSLILRFVLPENYGILTPPVASILRLPTGANAVETYQYYLKNIRRICEEYQFDNAADVDMALWVLSLECAAGKLTDSKIRQEFENDAFMLRLRAENMVAPFDSFNSAQLANTLCESNSLLATLAGCHALEENIREWARVEETTPQAEKYAQANVKIKNPTPSLKHYVDSIKNKSDVKHPSLLQLNFPYLIKIRNKVFHGGKLSERELKYLVDKVVKINDKLDTRKRNGVRINTQ